MDLLHPSALVFGLLIAAASAMAIYLVYSVVTSLYLNFLDFSRRFRGVE